VKKRLHVIKGQIGHQLRLAHIERDAAIRSMLAAEKEMNYALHKMREIAIGHHPVEGGTGFCHSACSDGRRWGTVCEWRDIALAAEAERDDLKRGDEQ